MIKSLLSFIVASMIAMSATAQDEYTLSPESGVVESLQTFTIEFPNATTLSRSALPGQVLLTSSNLDGEGNPITYTMNGLIRYDGNKVVMTIASAITDAGEYTFVIPDGYFLVDGNVFPPAIESKYTILKRIGKPTVMPAEGSVSSLKTFTARFYGETSISETDVKPYILSGDTKIDFGSISCSSYTMTLNLSEEITQNGTYKLVFPVGSVEDSEGNKNLDQFEYNYIIGATKIEVSASPAPGTYASLPTINLTFKGAASLAQTFTYQNCPYYTLNGGNKQLIMSFAVNDNVLTLNPNLSAAGDYKIVINENSLLINGSLNDQEYSFDYTIDPSAAVETIGKDEDNTPVDVYNLYGVKIATDVKKEDLKSHIPAGIYLIVKSPGSSEKVLVK